MSSDDIAIKYEAIIRKCYGCERYQHNADADIFRKLQELYVDALKEEKSSSDAKGVWSKYDKQLGIVIDSLRDALTNSSYVRLVQKLDSDRDEAVGLDAISYVIGEITANLFE